VVTSEQRPAQTSTFHLQFGPWTETVRCTLIRRYGAVFECLVPSGGFFAGSGTVPDHDFAWAFSFDPHYRGWYPEGPSLAGSADEEARVFAWLAPTDVQLMTPGLDSARWLCRLRADCEVRNKGSSSTQTPVAVGSSVIELPFRTTAIVDITCGQDQAVVAALEARRAEIAKAVSLKALGGKS
jgi:hypothetical protein